MKIDSRARFPMVLAFLLGGALISPSPVLASSPVDQAIQAGCTKRIVALGELPSHGEARAFASKAEIVRGLVERCNFKAVLFEAGQYEFSFLEKQSRAQHDFAVRLDGAIGRFWSVNELADWRQWIARNNKKKGDLYVGGIDDQPSATSVLTRQKLPELLSHALPKGERAQCRDAIARHLFWTYDDAHPYDAPEKKRLLQCATQARSTLSKGRSTGEDAALARAFANYVSREADAADPGMREQSMLETLQWHLGRLPEGSRVVIWTASVHAAKAQGGLPWEPLGAKLASLFGEDYMAVGFTALSGVTAMAGRAPSALPALPAGSLEARALPASDEAAYLGGSALLALDGSPSRLYGRIGSHPWSRHVDSVVVIREEIAPTAAASH